MRACTNRQVDRKLQGLPIDSETILTDDTVGDDDDGTTPPPSTCGDAPFCYGLLTPPSVEPFFLDWSTLVEIAETTPLETGYMEDTGVSVSCVEKVTCHEKCGRTVE